MSASKHSGLSRRHNTKADKQAKAEAEAAITPLDDLPLDPPPQLKAHPIAIEAYRELVDLYSQTSANLATGFDVRVVVNYCLLIEQLHELDGLRALSLGMLETLNKAQKRKGANVSELSGNIGYIAAAVNKLDARCDRKRALLLQYSDRLYLTPKARAGAKPPTKPAPPTADEMDAILDDLLDK